MQAGWVFFVELQTSFCFRRGGPHNCGERKATMFSLIRRNRIYSKQFTSEQGEPAFCLLSFNGKIRDDVLKRFNETYSVRGTHVNNGGAISPGSILTLLGSGGGALGLSAAMSGQLFMATANPATLMAIGGGVGSAVMGAGGIVAQAPFIPIAGAIMPVAAPLLAFVAISTILVMKQFKGIHEKLNRIENISKRTLQRLEAICVGKLISAEHRLNDLEEQLRICNRFTPDMIIRLCLAEGEVNSLLERYSILYQTASINADAALDDLQFKENDAYLLIVSTILDLKIDFLRLRLAIQENPGWMNLAVDSLVNKVDQYKKLWSGIGSIPSLTHNVATELRGAVKEMGWWGQTMPSYLLGKRAKRVEREGKAALFDKQAWKSNDDLAKPVEAANFVGQTISQRLAEVGSIGLVYWRDHHGEHSYYTDDFEVLPAQQHAGKES